MTFALSMASGGILIPTPPQVGPPLDLDMADEQPLEILVFDDATLVELEC